VAQVEIPHFDLPFRLLGSSGAAVVPQDSLTDIANCVEAAVRTQQGTRKEIPTFGVVEMTFGQQPLNVNDLMAYIVEHEPRAELMTEQNPKALEDIVAEVKLHVSSGVESEPEEADTEAAPNV